METQYTGRDHMAAVFGQGQTDRIAVRALQGFRPIMDRVNVSGKEVATQPDKFVQVLVTLWEAFPSDAMTILTSDPALFAEMAGITFKEFRAMEQGRNLLDDKSKLDSWEVRKAEEYPRLQYFVQICKLGKEAIQDAVLDAHSVSPWSMAMMLRGMENTIYDTADDKDFLHALLRFTTDLTKMIGDVMLDAGIGMLTLTDPSAGCSVISPTMFRTWVKPYLEEAIDHFKGRGTTPILLHICGYTDPILEDLLSLNIDGLSIDAPSSLAKAVEISQGKIALMGNFPGELYIEGTKEQIEEKVKESVAIAGEPNKYRYILSSGCQVPDTAPLDNVRAFLEAGRRYGGH